MRLPLFDRVLSGAATTNGNGSATDISGLFASSVQVSGITGTNPTVDAKIQESPDPETVADGDASWFDLVTFAQRTTNGGEKKVTTAPSFGRKRVVVTIGGTASPGATVKVVIEAQRDLDR